MILQANDPETRLDGEDHESLRLWLRLFTCTTLVEREIDGMLKRDFGSSLARFDLLAQLHRAQEGLRMTALSERTLTTNGNVTWLVAALQREGRVSRRVAIDDRRAAVVRLTPADQAAGGGDLHHHGIALDGGADAQRHAVLRRHRKRSGVGLDINDFEICGHEISPRLPG